MRGDGESVQVRLGECEPDLPDSICPESPSPQWRAKDAPIKRLVQSKALLLCPLPYSPTSARSVTRTARIGRTARLTVTLTALDDRLPLPFGADRTLLAWIQTLAFSSGFAAFDAVVEYLNAFGLGSGGRDYRVFRERLARLENLAVRVQLESADEVATLRLHPLKGSFLPRNRRSGTQTLAAAGAAPYQLLLRNRYGLALDPDFWAYLRDQPVALPFELLLPFTNRPKAWDFASFVLYRSFAAKQATRIPWSELVAQLASVDRSPRRLRATLGRVLEEIRRWKQGFPARLGPGVEGLWVEPWRG